MFNKLTSATQAELVLLNIYVKLKWHNKVWPKFYLLQSVNMVKPKAGAKHELLFNKMAVEHASLIKSSQQSVTKKYI
jgi:hypothetical protein